jgi:two-component system sensor kinase FixL
VKLAKNITKSRAGVLAANTALIAVIAVLDWKIDTNLSLGFAYVFPMLIAGYFLTRWRIFVLAVGCALLREAFSPGVWNADSFAGLVQAGFAYFGLGLFVRELVRARQQALEQSALRQEAEAQLRVLIDSSPAAILTLDGEDRVLLANEATHRLLGCAPGSLAGQCVDPYLPVLSGVTGREGAKRSFRSTVECTGRKQNGEPFLAQVWFSTYRTMTGPRLAAIVCDGSEELRDREGLSLHAMMTTSQILVMALLHEIRNLCAAAAVTHANLGRIYDLGASEDYRALGTLVKGLEKIAASELRLSSERATVPVDLHDLFEELRVLIEPSFREADVGLSWQVSQPLPLVRGDHHALLQVFLNLAQNSFRAMTGVERKELTVAASVEHDRLLIRFEDTGHGVPVPDRLFQPLQPGAEATGLGLYVSRAIVRSFAGDLHYEHRPVGSCFLVQLVTS